MDNHTNDMSNAERSTCNVHAATAWPVLAALLTGNEPPTAVDWEAIIALAERLQLSPLLHRLLQQNSRDLPATLRSRLANAHWATLGRNLRYEHRLEVMARAFAQAGIPLVILKGLALAETVYPGLGTRGMGDLDLLVRPADADRATVLLHELGYLHDEVSLSGHPLAFVRRYGEGLSFRQDDPFGCMVELHWRLLDTEWFLGATAVGGDELWPRIAPLTIGQASVWQLSPEDTLLYLGIHLAIHHGYGEVRLFVDLDRLIRQRPELDWDVCVERAQAWRLRNVTYFALRFARLLLDTPIPDGVWTQLQPPGATRWWIGRLISPARLVQGGLSFGPQGLRLLHFLLVDRWIDRLRGLLRVFFPGRAWIAARYSAGRPAALMLYGVLHPFRMLGLALRAIGQLGTRRRRQL
jgi:hypothetical protein